jgi:hypothetical protein
MRLWQVERREKFLSFKTLFFFSAVYPIVLKLQKMLNLKRLKLQQHSPERTQEKNNQKEYRSQQ